ncbi:hypothetical protein [Kitasatospora mediocidica]|uniref:hypothetical protein n=1 Tax=Kitasatospora mediocidica TaxID=58352 RepID=UPI00068FACBC|nr:hypothetical protein [Kitasatospora mediocidica]
MHGFGGSFDSTRTGRTALRSAAALVGAVLLVSGCGSGPPGYHPPQVPGSATVRSAQPAPSPSPTEVPYGTTLTQLVTPVNTALAEIGAAGSLDALAGALSDSQSAASAAATGLQQADAPLAVADAHRQLYVGLDQLATDLGQVQTDITDDKVCATSSALAEAGQSQGFKDVPAALAALSTAGYPATLTVPQTGALQHRALDNGSYVREGERDGLGVLTVENGGDADAVLTLTHGTDAAYSFYVVKGQTAKVSGIRDGQYDVYFAGGFDWDAASKRFTQSCAFTKFDDGLNFNTTDTTYSTWKLTLQPVAGGNASTTDVPEGSFPVP